METANEVINKFRESVLTRSLEIGEKYSGAEMSYETMEKVAQEYKESTFEGKKAEEVTIDSSVKGQVNLTIKPNSQMTLKFSAAPFALAQERSEIGCLVVE